MIFFLKTLDKIAKMMDLPYPGGPFIDRFAQLGNPNKYEFPISNIKEMEFRFSGIKTAVLYFLQKNVKEQSNVIEENKYTVREISEMVGFGHERTFYRAQKKFKF